MDDFIDDQELLAELRAAYGERVGPFNGRHHARFQDPDVPYHVVARTFQGLALLVPTDELNAIVAGVLGRALHVFPEVTLFGFAFLSNHFHAMLQGPAGSMSKFVGYVKKEISTRYGPILNWPGGWTDSLWGDRFLATGLPSAQSQRACLKYILSQGVKEGLVERPEHWPGMHAAKYLLSGETLIGTWLNGTKYGKAKYKQQIKSPEKRKPIDKARYTEEYQVSLGVIPAWQGLSVAQRQHELHTVADEIVTEGQETRQGKPPAGASHVLATPCTARWSLPKPPWFEERRAQVCWGSHKLEATRAYAKRYWEFQLSFRQAADEYKAGNENAVFPPGCFKPSVLHTGHTPRAST